MIVIVQMLNYNKTIETRVIKTLKKEVLKCRIGLTGGAGLKNRVNLKFIIKFIISYISFCVNYKAAIMVIQLTLRK